MLCPSCKHESHGATCLQESEFGSDEKHCQCGHDSGIMFDEITEDEARAILGRQDDLEFITSSDRVFVTAFSPVEVESFIRHAKHTTIRTRDGYPLQPHRFFKIRE